jgi:hypothetical protein
LGALYIFLKAIAKIILQDFLPMKKSKCPQMGPFMVESFVTIGSFDCDCIQCLLPNLGCGESNESKLSHVHLGIILAPKCINYHFV